MATPTSKRTPSPAFQFYPADFFGSSKVQRMSLTERGAYITLLAHCWLDGGLPNDPKQLAALLHVKPLQFDRMWACVLKECFVERNGVLINARLEIERKKQFDYKRRQSDNGKLGGRPNKANGNPEQAVGLSGLTQAEPKKSFSSSISISSSFSNKEHTRSALEEGFYQFWSAYPRKVGKDAAWREYQKIGPDTEVFFAIMQAVKSQRATWSDPKYIPYPRTWLHQGRWKDEEAGSSPSAALRPAWVCQHVVRCSNREMCRIATELGRPERAKEAS